eukprot:g617.t1
MSTRQREDNDGGDEVKIDGYFYKSLKKMKEYLRSEYEKKTKRWERQKGATYLHFAAYLGDIHATKMLIEDNSDVNAVTKKKKSTALHYAAYLGHVDVAKVLIENGADVNAVDKNKFTALHYTAEEGHVHVAKVLLQNGADVNAFDEDKWTALHLTVSRGHVDVAKVLIQNGADVNAVNELDGKTALHNVIDEVYIGDDVRMQIAMLLIQNGADVNIVDKKKRSALRIALFKRHTEVAKVLIQNGADANEFGILHSAAKKGYADVVKLLLQNGADVNSVLKEYRDGKISKSTTALDLAVRHVGKYAQVPCALLLICFGAEIDERTIEFDRKAKILRPIVKRLKLLRSGKSIGASMLSNEERRFMWNLALSFTIKHRAVAFRMYYKICSYITFHGIFMGLGYGLGKGSVWRRMVRDKWGNII